MKVKPHTCPHCGTTFDQASDPSDESAAPQVGSVTVCILCAGVCVFTKSMDLRVFTGRELAKLRKRQPAAHRTLMRIQAAVRQADRGGR